MRAVTAELIVCVAVMAGVTYLIRMIPFTLFRKKLTNRFLLSFFAYVPYAVLGAMTFPWIFYSTDSFISAAVGCAAALVLSYFEFSLTVVALCSCAAAYLCTFIVGLL